MGVQKQRKLAGRHSAKKILLLILWNLILVACAVVIIVGYSRVTLEQKNTLKKDAFCSAVESIKQVSENYLSTEKGYVDDWAAYIYSQHMTAEEALNYIKTTNTHEDRQAHLVNMDDWSARTTDVEDVTDDKVWVHCYQDMEKMNTKSTLNFLEQMRQVFDAQSDEVLVLGKYRVGEAQKTVISVGTRVKIREADGSDKEYLLLRLIPAEYMQTSWAFPTEFPSTEISLIAKDGGYVVQSAAMRSTNFLEFIRAYNFEDNYNKVNELAEELETSEKGLLEYKDSKGQLCYFYYSSMGPDSNIDVLGYIPVSEIRAQGIEWKIILLICGALLLICISDGAYILSINHRLHKAVKMAEKASLAKTQFLSSMSHDIRTPMNAVIGMTEIAKNHLDNPKFARECLDKAHMSGNHLLTLINDILDISKVESGMMTLNPVPVSVHMLTDEISAIIGQSASDKGLHFEVKMHDITHDAVMADPLRMRQILINLLNNAVKYTESGGHVTFEVSEYTLPEQKETHAQSKNAHTQQDKVSVQNEVSDESGHAQAALQFVITDDGMGMSKEFQKMMYQSFARATDSRINTIQGSGLGLAIVRQMIDLMGGSIVCDSEEGKGTTFTVKLMLPVADELPDNALASSSVMQDGSVGEFAGMRVLVAEDNELNWEIINIMLQEYGIIADHVENGKKCVDRLNQLCDSNAPRYDMVLMDVQMPVMDGREATRRLRASDHEYLRNIPVAAMTADAFAEDIYACMAAGMDAHISKPIDIKQVLGVLRKAKSGMLRK